jgi:hypothetical protein
MRDHNETHERPEHREHPNHGLVSFSPWGGDNLEECEEHPCRDASSELEVIAPEFVLVSDVLRRFATISARA